MSTTRLEAFSDGVIAVAITLLVLNIGVPDLQHGETLAHGLAQNWPSYAASIAASRASPPTRSPPRWPPSRRT